VKDTEKELKAEIQAYFNAQSQRIVYYLKLESVDHEVVMSVVKR